MGRPRKASLQENGSDEPDRVLQALLERIAAADGGAVEIPLEQAREIAGRLQLAESQRTQMRAAAARYSPGMDARAAFPTAFGGMPPKGRPRSSDTGVMVETYLGLLGRLESCEPLSPAAALDRVAEQFGKPAGAVWKRLRDYRARAKRARDAGAFESELLEWFPLPQNPG